MRLQKSWLILCVLFSGCGHLPAITSCIWDQPRQKFHCINPKGEAIDLVAADPESDKMICIPFQDFDTLISYCKGKK